MNTVKNKIRTNPSWTTRFWAVVKYELLWNIRKKKFLGMVIVAFVFATLGLALPVILSNMIGQSLSQEPDYAISYSAGSLGFFLFALVTVMNSISGEFESGTIVTLLTKPVSRTTVFLGKLFAAFITLLSAYAVLFAYTTIGATIVYGPQNNLYLVPLSLLGNITSTFVWVAIVLAIGSLSKSSLIVALGAFGIFMALLISAPIILVFSDQAWVLSYLPVSGTDNIATNMITYVLHPSSNVTFFRILEPISLVLLRSIAVALTYVLAFSLISWYALKRAQILE